MPLAAFIAFLRAGKYDVLQHIHLYLIESSSSLVTTITTKTSTTTTTTRDMKASFQGDHFSTHMEMAPHPYDFFYYFKHRRSPPLYIVVRVIIDHHAALYIPYTGSALLFQP